MICLLSSFEILSNHIVHFFFFCGWVLSWSLVHYICDIDVCQGEFVEIANAATKRRVHDESDGDRGE